MSFKIRTLIVDDEPPARERLSTLLSAHPRIEIVAEAGDVEAAAALFTSLKPDLIFLDIQLPRASGFELLPLLAGNPAVIFVTAYDQFAARAFEVNALDYLLKPIHAARLADSIERLRTPVPDSSQPLTELDLVALKEDNLLRMVPIASISHIVAADNYTSVYLLDKGSAFVRRTLAQWEKILPSATFVRVNRSLIVRVDAIRSLHAESRDSTAVMISGQDQPILLGRRAALSLRRALENRGEI